MCYIHGTKAVLRRPVEFAQYTSFRFTQHLIDAGIDASIGTVGDALDNALAESTIGLFKTELIKPQGPWHNLRGVDAATAAWVDCTIFDDFTEPAAAGHRSSTRPCTSWATWSAWLPDPNKESLPNPGRFTPPPPRPTRHLTH